jgi:hypothetical protein
MLWLNQRNQNEARKQGFTRVDQQTLENQLTSVAGFPTKGAGDACVLREPGMPHRKFTHLTVAFLQKSIKPLC